MMETLNSDQRIASRYGLGLGALARKHHQAETSGNSFRRSLEDLSVQSYGCIDVEQATLINTTVRFERLARMTDAWLREFDGNLSHCERLTYANQGLLASIKRDEAVRRLNLCANTGSISQQPQQAASLAQQHGDATQGDASHTEAQHRTDEPASSLLDASPPAELANSSEAGVEDSKIVNCGGDNESPVDRDVEFQQLRGSIR